MASKNILLIEPGYKNKYPPLGLMKIAQYHGPNGKGDNVKFIKGEDRTVLDSCWDRVYVTTLFSFEWKRISESIDFAIEASGGQPCNVFVGGIAASLMHQAFVDEARWRGVRFIKGLLKYAPAVSLQLNAFEEELYSDDTTGYPIEELIPDYSILNQIKDKYTYPVQDAYFGYASRGCVRKCSFCGVPKLEGDLYEAPSLAQLVHGIEKLYGTKKDLVLMDNNVVASPRFKEIIAEIRGLGFTPRVKLKRGRIPVLRRVDFNQGVDARILCKDRMFLRELASICIKPLRIAFDHIGLRKPYETSIRFAHDAGLDDLSNYMLYNFHDSPAAFGSSEQEFETLLMRPHKFIFKRVWFEELGGRPQFEEYLAEAKSMSPSDKSDLLAALSGFENSKYDTIRQGISNSKVARLFRFYEPLDDPAEREIWEKQKEFKDTERRIIVPDDERVEDAGLELETVLKEN